MFKFNELQSIHLEISTRCQASCPMCPRKYHGGVENKNLKIADWTYEEFVTVFDQTLLNQITLLYFCGNFGDPIMNDDLIKMCEHVKKHKPSLSVRIHTNGGARSTQWWKNLYNALPSDHIVLFGIDGLEDTNHLYRAGVDYKTLMRNATTFIDAGGITEWVFIKFKHNEHQALHAETLSKELGFKRFTVKNTTRFIGEEKFSVLDKDGNVEYYIEPPSSNVVNFVSESMIRNYKSVLRETSVDCYVLKSKEIYIDAHKHVFPCCFLASTPYNYQPTNPPENELKSIIRTIYDEIYDQYVEIVENFGGIENLSALKHQVKDIIDSDKWQTSWNEYWNNKKLITCVRVCGKTDSSKPKDQFVKRINND
jgi:MoaA/NifB/PqqE/SkfB family radical SAM enzyme